MFKKIIVFILLLCIGFILIGGPQWLLRQYAFSLTDETKTHLFYVLKKDDKPYIIRCEKGVIESLSHYHLYDKRVRIITYLLSSKDDLPSNKESDELNKFEERIVNAAISDKGKNFMLGGYVTGGGKKEIFLYANNLKKINEVFKDIQYDLPNYTFMLDVQEDKNWSYYNAFCEDKKFPPTN